MVSLRNLLGVLDREGLNLMILSGGKTIYRSKEDGIKPLIAAINSIEKKKLKDSTVIDKVIGKASALLISYFEAKDAAGKVVSESGAKVLSKHGIEYFAETMTKEIRNQTDTDVCPFEKLVRGTSSPRKAYELIGETIAKGSCK